MHKYRAGSEWEEYVSRAARRGTSNVYGSLSMATTIAKGQLSRYYAWKIQVRHIPDWVDFSKEVNND